VIAAIFGIALIALYARALHLYNRRFPAHPIAPWRVAAFVCGIASLCAALSPPLDRAADASFAAHMSQHMVLWLIAPPLILMGAPLLLLVAVPPAAFARRITAFANSQSGHALFSPLTGWLSYVFVLWGAHFSPLYELALRYPAVHVVEHALFLLVAFLFWGTIVQAGYAPRPVPHAVRAFLLFFTIPQGAFLGFALNATQHVLYPSYLARLGAAAALVDQHNGADIMWILGGFLLFVAFMCAAAAWAASERSVARA
jgi:putative membrane protein